MRLRRMLVGLAMSVAAVTAPERATALPCYTPSPTEAVCRWQFAARQRQGHGQRTGRR